MHVSFAKMERALLCGAILGSQIRSIRLFRVRLWQL